MELRLKLKNLKKENFCSEIRSKFRVNYDRSGHKFQWKVTQMKYF